MLKLCALVAVLGATAGPAGVGDPDLPRVVTIGGVVGAAYYSAIDGGYRFVGGRPSLEGGELRFSSLGPREAANASATAR